MSHSLTNIFDKKALVLIFGIAIYIPLFVGLFQTDQSSSNVEKRELAKLPTLPASTQEIKKYPEAFNLYYSDHFGLREQFTEAYFSLIYKIGSQNSVGEVTFGQDGWMFLGNIKPGIHTYNDPMGDALNKNLFSEQQLAIFAQSIMAIKNWLNNKGIEYIYVIAPNKHTIYFDKMPEYISKQNKESATDQLVAYLKTHTNVSVVDLRPALLEEKKKHQVFFKTDSHWTFHGANAAQFEIMKKVEAFFPRQIKPVFLEDHQFGVSTKNNGDLAKLAKTGIIVEDLALPVFKPGCQLVKEDAGSKNSVIDTFVCQTEGLNTVIFRDSFFNYLQTYIARYFHRSIYIPGRVNYSLLKQYIELEKPDIVIEEVVEREFPYLPSAEFLQNLH